MKFVNKLAESLSTKYIFDENQNVVRNGAFEEKQSVFVNGVLKQGLESLKDIW